jgi:hypothetical protein
LIKYSSKENDPKYDLGDVGEGVQQGLTLVYIHHEFELGESRYDKDKAKKQVKTKQI